MIRKPKLNKWNFLLKWDYSAFYNDPFMRVLTFGVFKVTSYPPEGTKLTKKYYKGLLRVYNIRLLIVREK